MKAAFTFTLVAMLAGADAPAGPAAATVKVAAAGGTGSGVVIGRGGPDVYVLTAAHVVPTGKAATVTLPGGKAVKAELVARDDGPDLALVRFAAAPGVPAALKLAPVNATPKAVTSGGWEAGAAPTSRPEAIKTKARVKRPGEAVAVLCWETAQRPAAGRSGGPLADEAGRLVGVAAGHDGATGFYTHADEVRAFLRRHGLNWLVEDR